MNAGTTATVNARLLSKNSLIVLSDLFDYLNEYT